MEAQVSSEHEIEDHEQILVILKSEAEVADEGRVDLLEETAFLYDIADRALLRTGWKALRGCVAEEKGKVATSAPC